MLILILREKDIIMNIPAEPAATTQQDRDIELKLERLKELESKVDNIQSSNRERVKKFLDKQKRKGKKQISALISQQAYEIINNRRDKSIKAGAPLTASDIIEQALLFLDNRLKDSVNINVNVKPCKTDIEMKAPEQQPTITTPEPVPPVQAKQNTTPAEPETPLQIVVLDTANIPDKTTDKTGFKTWLFTQIKALKQAGNGYIQIAEMLNKAGVKTVRAKEFNAKRIEKFFNTNK